MRKSVLERHPAQAASQPDENWLEVERLATVQVTSENPAFPIESVFSSNGGWRAGQEGDQVIRLVFDQPLTIHRIWLRFSEREISRTQQFTLRWSGPGAQTTQEIVRQQWNFNPGASTEEIEDYRVNLNGVSILELAIQPEITAGKAVANLASWRVA
jgi:hypothetical protein